MPGMKESSEKWQAIFLYSVFFLIIFLLIMRFLKLEIDPPYFFSGYSQSQLTDPYHITFFARNAVLFDDWNPFDYHRWDIFKYSIVSGFSYVIFSLFGVSRITANLTGLILNIGGLFLFVLGMWGYREKRELLMTSLLLLSSGLLIFHARLPYLENGLIFFSGLIFFAFMRFHKKRWGQFLTGFLVALAALAGKLFGLLILAPVVISLIFIYRSKCIKPILVSLAGLISGTLIYVLVFYGGDISILMNYYAEQTVGIYGMPKGILSPAVLILKLMTFGSDSGLFYFAPFYIILACLGMAVYLLSGRIFETWKPEYLPIIFAIVWLAAGFAGLAIHNYRPLRYQIFLLLPASVLAAFFVETALSGKRSVMHKRKLIIIPMLFLTFWYLATQVFLFFVPDGFKDGAGAAIEAAAAAFLFIILYWKINRFRKLNLRWIAIPLLLGLFVRQGILIYQGLALPGTYLRDYNHELAQLIDKDAIITGPYAPAFTIDNNLKGIIYVFGLANIEPDLFKRYPITHILTDVGNWNLATREYPFLKNSLSAARMKLCDGTVELFRLPDADIPETEYEKAGRAYLNKAYDLSRTYSESFVKSYPDNLSGRFGLVASYYALGMRDKLLSEINFLTVKYPDNFRMHAFVYYSYQTLFKKSGDKQYQQLAEHHFARAREINPVAKP